MQSAIVTRGRLTGPRQVELDEAVSEMTGEVEVILLARGGGGNAGKDSPDENMSQFLRRLPPGTRGRTEIDQDLANERAGWGDRE
jgi:hypothetical protein